MVLVRHAPRPVLTLGAASELPSDLVGLDFAPTMLGHSRAEIIPQRVGRWWLAPLETDSCLPSRARHRLEAVRATGLSIKAVVLFHEIPPEPRSPQTDMVSLTGRLGRWAEQELPALSTSAVTRAREVAPIVGSAARVAISLTAVGLAACAAVMITLTLAVLSAALADPCLVVVTEDGYWIEIDRWVE